MISTSTTEPVPFTPKWREGDADAPVYHVRAGSVIERAQLEAELAGQHRAGRVFSFELHAAIDSGLRALLTGDPELDRSIELAIAEDKDLTAEDRQFANGLRATLAEFWPEYRDLVAQSERRREIAPVLALRRFLVGLENVGVELERGRDGLVAETTLAALNPIEMLAAGNFAYSLLYGSAEKNSERPLSSDSGQSNSNSGERSKAAGKSTGKGGRKTHA